MFNSQDELLLPLEAYVPAIHPTDFFQFFFIRFFFALIGRVMSGDYYYPTLHQYKIELEDALSTANDQSAYFRYDDSEFPGFSWRGYVVFSQAQVILREQLA